MCGDRLLDELVMHLQQLQHAGFISPHLAAQAHDVGEHDRRQSADSGWRPAAESSPIAAIILQALCDCQIVPEPDRRRATRSEAKSKAAEHLQNSLFDSAVDAAALRANGFWSGVTQTGVGTDGGEGRRAVNFLLPLPSNWLYLLDSSFPRSLFSVRH
jgi:hypothetical protein